MDVRVGIDLAVVDDVRAALAEHGQHYLDRVYTTAEQADCDGRPDRLATRFAVKEAVRKLLQPGRTTALAWTDVGVVTVGGAPRVVLTGTARTRADSLGMESLHVSLARAGGLACALVVAETITAGKMSQTSPVLPPQ